MNPKIMRLVGLGKMVDEINSGNCPTCGKLTTPRDFREEESRIEYYISGMCQKCQDEVFGE